MTFRTDKVVNGYLPTYLGIAAKIGTAGRVCEIGVDRGYSLQMWQALFPHGYVVGVDSNPDACWPEGTHRIVGDQAGSRLPDALTMPPGPPRYDLIVDDASHEGGRTKRTFELLWPLVAPGGWYVVEDWGVGFDSYPGRDQSMLQFAQSLLHLCDRYPDQDVEQITYRGGLIVLNRKPACYPGRHD